MIRLSAIVWMAIIFAAALSLYLVKYQVEEVKERVDMAEVKLERLDDSLHMLRVEWSYLSRPGRIEKMVKKHMEMMPLGGERVVDVSVIPKANSPLLNAAYGEE